MITATTGNGHTPRADVLERVVAEGDLAALTPQDRVAYYLHVCKSVGLNPATRPFEYIKLNGKLTFYTRKDATDQLRSIYKVSIRVTKEDIDGCVAFRATATTHDGRVDESIGAVASKGLAGENLANAVMKAETKAKRRVTLSICGLGFTDESEIDSIPGAQRVTVTEAGEIIAPAPPKSAPAPKAPLAQVSAELVRSWEEQLLLANSEADILAVHDDVISAVKKYPELKTSRELSELRKLKEERLASILADVPEVTK